jgi:hypothetical protein
MPMLSPSGRTEGRRAESPRILQIPIPAGLRPEGKAVGASLETSGVGAGPNKPFEPTPRRRRGSSPRRYRFWHDRRGGIRRGARTTGRPGLHNHVGDHHGGVGPPPRRAAQPAHAADPRGASLIVAVRFCDHPPRLRTTGSSARGAADAQVVGQPDDSAGN